MSVDDRTASADAAGKQRAAFLRAMPITRMLDYGMDYWDARHLTDAPVDRPWDEVAEQLADAQLSRAHSAVQQEDDETAEACFRRAAAALIFAQMAFYADTDRKLALYSKLVDAYRSAASLGTRPHVERLDVSYSPGQLTSWLVRPSNDHRGAAVVIIGGNSGWGPAYHLQAEALARRGLTAVLLELPGQGETRMRSGLYMDSRVDDAFAATLDAVQYRTGHDGPFGVWGNSLGGLLAARAAIHDTRFGACCVNGADPRPELRPFRAVREQTYALLGVDTDEAAAATLRTWWVDPRTHHTDAALLVLHGGQDPLITFEQQQVFLGLSHRSTMRVWDDGEHTIYNHSAERTDFVADWFRHALVDPAHHA